MITIVGMIGFLTSSRFSTDPLGFRVGGICISLFLVGLGSGDLRGEAFVSDSVGYYSVPCLPGSDTIVSVPFQRTPVQQGKLASLPNLSGSIASLVPEASPIFVSRDFLSEPHYLVFRGASSGSGWHFPIVFQDEATLKIELGQQNLPDLSIGDVFEVIPYWTLETLFPIGDSTIHDSTNLLLSGRGSEILFFDRESASIDLAPSRKFFRTAQGWKEAIRGFPDADQVTIPPGVSFVIRHPANAASTTFVAFQKVDSDIKAYPLKTSVDQPRDNHLASVRPVPVKLRNLDLEAPAFSESASTAISDRKDELHVFDNTASAINRKASAIYFRVGGQWVESDQSQSFPIADDVEIGPGAGLMVRKVSTADGAQTVWINTPRY